MPALFTSTSIRPSSSAIREGRVHLRPVGQVRRGDGDRRVRVRGAQAPRGVGERRLVPVHQRNGVAGGREGFGDAVADAARAAGDEGDVPVRHHVASST